MEIHNPKLRAQSIKKVDVEVASHVLGIPDDEAVAFIIESGADGRVIRDIRDQDKKWKSRKDAAEEYFTSPR